MKLWKEYKNVEEKVKNSYRGNILKNYKHNILSLNN